MSVPIHAANARGCESSGVFLTTVFQLDMAVLSGICEAEPSAAMSLSLDGACEVKPYQVLDKSTVTQSYLV